MPFALNRSHKVDEINRKIVRGELLTALSIVTAGLMLLSLPFVTFERWWVGIVAALVTFVLILGSDRYRAGYRALLAGGLLAMALIVTGIISVSVLPFVVGGMGVGSAVNRLLFGVLRPVPPLRRQREEAPAPNWYPF